MRGETSLFSRTRKLFWGGCGRCGMGRMDVASKRLPSQARSTRACPEAGMEVQLAEARLEAMEWRAYAIKAAHSRNFSDRKLRDAELELEELQPEGDAGGVAAGAAAAVGD